MGRKAAETKGRGDEHRGGEGKEEEEGRGKGKKAFTTPRKDASLSKVAI